MRCCLCLCLPANYSLFPAAASSDAHTHTQRERRRAKIAAKLNADKREMFAASPSSYRPFFSCILCQLHFYFSCFVSRKSGCNFNSIYLVFFSSSTCTALTQTNTHALTHRNERRANNQTPFQGVETQFFSATSIYTATPFCDAAL